jgi:YegS/Rv2252/BmrU family lipid kinase
MTKRRILFIVNPISGGRKKHQLKALLDRQFSHEEIEYSISYSEYPKHAGILAEEGSDFDLIVGVGGDGTINEIAQKTSESNTPLAIIPMGSGNGLARHLKIPLKMSKALKLLSHHNLVKLDTATLNGHFFVSIAGLGFDSIVAAEFVKTRGRGFVNYARIAMQKFFQSKEKEYEMVLDGKSYTRKAFMITFANSNQFGYNTIISPHADCRDSYLDVCIVRKPKIVEIPGFLIALWTGKADRSKHVEIIKARKISLKQSDSEYANVDGESIKVGHQIEVNLKSANLDVLLP